MSLADALKKTMAGAGGPVATLLNPHAMRAIGENVNAAITALPPSSVIIGAGTRLMRDAIVAEWKAKGPSTRFLDACRISGRFDNDEQILAFHAMLVDDI